MARWWRCAQVVSAVGTGALILGGGPAVYAAEMDDSTTSPVEVAGADDLNFWSQWVRTSEVVRFRVWLEGSGTDARLAVVTTPAEALKSVECPQEDGAQAPVSGGAQMCSLGTVATRSSVDVLLAMPKTARGVELTAVARMRNREGEWVTHTARTTVGEPAAKVAEVVEVADSVVPRPAPGVSPWTPGAAAENAGAAAGAVAGAAGQAAVPAVPGRSSVQGLADPAKLPRHLPAPLAPPNPQAPRAPRAVEKPGARAVPSDPRSKDPSKERGMPMILEEPSTPEGSASIYVDPQAEPEAPGAPGAGNPGVVPYGMGSGGPGAVPEPVGSVSGRENGMPLAPRSVDQAGQQRGVPVPQGGRVRAALAKPPSARARTLAETGRMPRLTGQALRMPPQAMPFPQAPQAQLPQQMVPFPQGQLPPQAVPFPQAQLPQQVVPFPQAQMPQAPGQLPPVWNDPNLQMPQAPPAPAAPALADPQPLGAPLPRDLDGTTQEITPVADSGPMLTGMRGLPVVGVAVGGLLGVLWLQMRVQRRRETRPVL